jgi:hypothetical protein
MWLYKAQNGRYTDTVILERYICPSVPNFENHFIQFMHSNKLMELETAK